MFMLLIVLCIVNTFSHFQEGCSQISHKLHIAQLLHTESLLNMTQLLVPKSLYV